MVSGSSEPITESLWNALIASYTKFKRIFISVVATAGEYSFLVRARNGFQCARALAAGAFDCSQRDGFDMK